jgi:cytochrome P450
MRTFDPFDPAHLTEGVPFDELRSLRAECPVARTPAGSWYLSRRSDAERVLKDIDAFRADLGPITGVRGLEDVPDDQLFLSELEEPRHGQVRRIYNACFGPHRVRAAEPRVREICADLLDPLVGAGEVDLNAYAAPIPGLVIGHMMDLPPEGPGLFLQWSAEETLLKRPVSPGVDGPPIHTWFAGLVAQQRKEPTNHIFRQLLETPIEGEPLTDTEIATQLHFMVMAGVHTTRGLLTHVVQRLALTPSLFATLDADRALVPLYVEESLRHDAPVQRNSRRCTATTEIEGHVIEVGDWVEVGIGSANRDLDDGDVFRLDRDDPRDHLAFGAGSHVCPGATLARLEAATAVEALLDRCASIEPVEGATYPPVPGSLGYAPIPAVLLSR